jgi:hypothetical protein
MPRRKLTLLDAYVSLKFRFIPPITGPQVSGLSRRLSRLLGLREFGQGVRRDGSDA